jgi:hypothetical protein
MLLQLDTRMSVFHRQLEGSQALTKQEAKQAMAMLVPSEDSVVLTSEEQNALSEFVATNHARIATPAMLIFVARFKVSSGSFADMHNSSTSSPLHFVYSGR